jgi:aryl-alcohol dehydrogenase-like predicted oxidoreductase
MQYRKFGRMGWSVSEIGYGMWGMGGWTGSDDQASLQSLQRALELGCNFFDTAWVYGLGKSELLLGEALRRWRATVGLSYRSHPRVHGEEPREPGPGND